jgi:hypothetical protein
MEEALRRVDAGSLRDIARSYGVIYGTISSLTIGSWRGP